MKGTRTWGKTTQHNPWSILDPNVRTCSNIKHEVSQPICTPENQRGPAPAMRWALQSPLGSAPILRRCPLRSRSFLQASSVKLHIYSSSTVVVAVWWFLMVFDGFWWFFVVWRLLVGPQTCVFFLCVFFFWGRVETKTPATPWVFRHMFAKTNPLIDDWLIWSHYGDLMARSHLSIWGSPRDHTPARVCDPFAVL